ncbi:protease SohB [Acidithiobacillus sp. AMEEHan]|uniref:protease SohB n=1 Tax=Acidithiobacillus sp. AMEEHan TaxID=2994951 RepID=UPI0027E5743F|nr:protease SohB [Acidithiobacillus sp. AMEEHan]
MLLAYLLFLAESATVVVASLLFLSWFPFRRQRDKGANLRITDLGQRYEERASRLLRQRLPKKEAKAILKQRKKALQERAKQGPQSCLYVLDFKGDLRASAVETLRQEIDVILAARQDGDRVCLRLESGGGMVNTYGLAAAQLLRLREAGLELSVLVDSVAASGGYLMAAVAQRIVASPFALVGSIGVIAQVPNFHRWLREHNIDFEQFTAGKYKRTVTIFGENTEAGREKLREELGEIHGQFRELIGRYRPQLDLERVATGEAWLGERALELGLVDELATSDGWIQRAAETQKVLLLGFAERPSLAQRLGLKAQQVWDGIWTPPLA